MKGPAPVFLTTLKASFRLRVERLRWLADGGRDSRNRVVGVRFGIHTLKNAANITNLPPAMKCPVRSRFSQRTRSASPGSTSPVRATDGPASRDRTCGSGFRRTRRTLPAPALRSIVDKKDAPELPPDRGDTKALLVADATCVFPSPWQDTTLNHSRCKVINRELLPAHSIRCLKK